MRTSIRRTVLAATSATALVGALSAPAFASATGPNEGVGGSVTKFNQFQFYNGGDATAMWSTHDDSPADTNHKAIVNTVPITGSDYTYAFTNHSALGAGGGVGTKGLNVSAGDLKNVSLDFDSAHAYGGGFRFNVILQDAGGIASSSSSYLFLSINACVSSPYGTSSWKRADFTGDTTAGECSVTYVDKSDPAIPTQTTYTSDGTSTSLQLFAAANPTAPKVSQVYVINDGAGTYVYDRVALGSGYLYNNSLTKGLKCTDETSC